ncbi:MAG TPA: formate dehydrogenase accessory sulfurtransferase FdhD [Vicinamibacterales bacterium]|nr:formate dehydrogenase accessory sulfurtransferase FdhD [Vicinamibacterales bacterium]
MSDTFPPPVSLRPIRRVEIVRLSARGTARASDDVAVEEPLEIRLHDRPFAVVMRTPGHDRELAAGFLLSEGVIGSVDDLGAVEHCRHPDEGAAHNVVNVFFTPPGGAARLEAAFGSRRHVAANTSCGICGRVTIEALQTRAAPLPMTCELEAGAAQGLPDVLRGRQSAFDQTGGLHAAALVGPDGDCLAAAEDVGRHNAVDKVLGRMLLEERLPLLGCALVVSGRVSYEIVQKAWLGGVEVICAVSAPSSLAIDLALAAGITLIGFARDRGFNVYTHPGRLRGM